MGNSIEPGLQLILNVLLEHDCQIITRLRQWDEILFCCHSYTLYTFVVDVVYG